MKTSSLPTATQVLDDALEGVTGCRRSGLERLQIDPILRETLADRRIDQVRQALIGLRRFQPESLMEVSISVDRGAACIVNHDRNVTS